MRDLKRYEVGMYGGKFAPFHIGHLYCLATAAEECEQVYLLLFYTKTRQYPPFNIFERMEGVVKAANRFDNVDWSFICTDGCLKADGTEDWDAETPMVWDACGERIDAVYSSEPSDPPYFSRAYPEAEIRLVDPDRKRFPISGTEVRRMRREGDPAWKAWTV